MRKQEPHQPMFRVSLKKEDSLDFILHCFDLTKVIFYWSMVTSNGHCGQNMQMAKRWKRTWGVHRETPVLPLPLPLDYSIWILLLRPKVFKQLQRSISSAKVIVHTHCPTRLLSGNKEALSSFDLVCYQASCTLVHWIKISMACTCTWNVALHYWPVLGM